jgi:hypothetical protein
MNTTILHFFKKKRENHPPQEEDVKICFKKTPSNVTFIEVQKNDSLLRDSDMPRKWSIPSMFHRRSRSVGSVVKTASRTFYSTDASATPATPKKSFSVRLSPIILTGITGIKIDSPNHKEPTSESDNTPKDTPVGYIRLWETESVVLEPGSREIVKSIPLPTGFLESDEKVTGSIYVIWAQQKQKNGFFFTVNLFDNEEPDFDSESCMPALIKLEIGVIIQGQECPYGLLVFDANSIVEGQHTVETQVVECLEIPDCPTFMEKTKIKNRNHKFLFLLRSESSFRMRLVVQHKDADLDRCNRQLVSSEDGEQLWKAVSVYSQDSENSFVAPNKNPEWNVFTAAALRGCSNPIVQECDEEREAQEEPRETNMDRFPPEVAAPKINSVFRGSSKGGDILLDRDSEELERDQRSEPTSNDEYDDQPEGRCECMFADVSLKIPRNESKRQSSNKMNFGRALASKFGIGRRSRLSQTTCSQAMSIPSVALTSTISRESSKKYPPTYGSDAETGADTNEPLVFVSEIGIPTEESASTKEQSLNILNDDLAKQESQTLGSSEWKVVAASKDHNFLAQSNDLTKQESLTLGFNASTMSDFSHSVMTSRSLLSLPLAKLEQLALALGMELDDLLDELSALDDGTTTIPKSLLVKN